MKIWNDLYPDTLITKTNNILPIIDSNHLPPNLYNGLGGGIAYDKTTQRVYYNDGSIWKPISNSAPIILNDYSLIKSGNQNIIPLTPTIIAPFSSTPNPPYFDTTGGWNTLLGIFTAPQPITLRIEVYIAWQTGISNLGNRTLQIVYKPALGLPIIAKEDTTQADPDTNVETTQTAGIAFQLLTGDQCWVQVLHNAPVNLIIAGGTHTTIYG